MSKELVEELRETFDYHPDGYLIRKKNGKPCGQRADTRNGYTRVKVNGRVLKAHRIIYAIVYGEMPMEVDHINGVRIDNRIENLRDVPKSENQHNSKKRKDNSSGFPGVHWHTPNTKNGVLAFRLISGGYISGYSMTSMTPWKHERKLR